MPDQKVSQLGELTELTGDDLLYVVNAPGTSPASNRIASSNARKFLAQGAPGIFYVAASDATAAERDIADYKCDGTADNVEIQAAIDAAAGAGVGAVVLSTGAFNLAAETALLGANDKDIESWLALTGQGKATRLIAGSGLAAAVRLGNVWQGALTNLRIEVGGATHGVRAVATNTAGAGYRSFWGSHFADVQVVGPWDTTHTGWAWHLESPFRSTFTNLEMGGVGNGIRLFSSNDAFNPGDCTFIRSFADLSGNNKTAFSVESTAAVGNMNQIVFIMLEAIASGTGCTGIYVGGSGGTPGPANYTEWIGCQLEQFDTLVNVDRGEGSDFSLNYIECRGVNGNTAFKFGTNAFNNKIRRAGQVHTANTLALVNDGNTALPEQPNIVQGAKVYKETGANVTVTLNPAKTTVLRDIVANGPGTIADDALAPPAGSVRTNLQTGTSYTLALGDAGGVVERSNAAANTVTIPPNSSVAFPVGTLISIEQTGAGTTTVQQGAGVTIQSAGGLLNIAAQYAAVSLRKKATNTWSLVGSLA